MENKINKIMEFQQLLELKEKIRKKTNIFWFLCLCETCVILFISFLFQLLNYIFLDSKINFKILRYCEWFSLIESIVFLILIIILSIIVAYKYDYKIYICHYNGYIIDCLFHKKENKKYLFIGGKKILPNKENNYFFDQENLNILINLPFAYFSNKDNFGNQKKVKKIKFKNWIWTCPFWLNIYFREYQFLKIKNKIEKTK